MKSVTVVLTILVVAMSMGTAQEPKKPDEKKPESVTKQTLLGDWEYTHKDGTTVALLFTEKLVVVSILGPRDDRKEARKTAEWASGGLGRKAGAIGSTAY